VNYLHPACNNYSKADLQQISPIAVAGLQTLCFHAATAKSEYRACSLVTVYKSKKMLTKYRLSNPAAIIGEEFSLAMGKQQMGGRSGEEEFVQGHDLW
jgi:hypothetical protein